jgi:hypothetical protein
MLDPHPAAAAAPLPTTRQVEGDAGPHGSVGQERANLDLDHLAGGLEDDDGSFVVPFDGFGHSTPG